MTLNVKSTFIMTPRFELTPDATRRQLAVRGMDSSSILKIRNKCTKIFRMIICTRHQRWRQKTSSNQLCFPTSHLHALTSAKAEGASVVVQNWPLIREDTRKPFWNHLHPSDNYITFSEDISRPESNVIQPPRVDSTPDRMSRHVANYVAQTLQHWNGHDSGPVANF